MLSRITDIAGRRRASNRALTALRALLRSNEFYLIPLALVIGVVAGAIVTLMSEIAQIAHVLIFGIPIDVRLSANAYCQSGRSRWSRPRSAGSRSASWNGRGAA